jgi:hypothetical protein
MKTIEEFNEIGIYPELSAFGTGKDNGPFYELDIYVKGVDACFNLRRGSGDVSKTRNQHIETLIEYANKFIEYKEWYFHSDFIQGWHYFHENQLENCSEPFRKGVEVKKLFNKLNY